MTPVRLAVAGAVWLVLFALVFSVGAALGAWPEPPQNFLHGTDLGAGVVFAGVLLVGFLLPRHGARVG